MSGHRVFAKGFGSYGLSKNQVKVLMVLKAAAEEKPRGRHVTAAEVSGANMSSFYRLRHFSLVRSRMTPGGRFEPRYGLIWTITETGRQYLAALVEQLNREAAE